MTCCSGLACVVLVLGLVAVLTFCPLHVPLLLISCFADIIVAGCCGRFASHFGMRDMLHLCGPCCAFVLWVCRGSDMFSPRTPFYWISCLDDINLLQVIASGLVCIWVCVTFCIRGARVVLVI